ncbi:MAG TPA: VOC family protein [Ohtaekwangia sp.]|uniref:VOC family protein n=1 Tax=Ohtaekwangia sp. TaxID=2066019 RepID=UPI002F921851
MNLLKIKETCLYIHDLNKAKRFYHEVLDLPVISYVKGKHIFFRAGSSVLLCFNPEDSKLKTSPPPHYGNGKLHFAFEVASADYLKVKEEIRLKGISIIAEVTWKSGKESFYFEDPEGNVLEVVPDEGIWE